MTRAEAAAKRKKRSERLVRASVYTRTIEEVADDALAGDEAESDALVTVALLARMAQRNIREALE